MFRRAFIFAVDVKSESGEVPHADGVLCLRQTADWSVDWLHHPVFLLEKSLFALQMNEGLGVQPNPALLVPLVVDVDPVLELRAGFSRTCWAGWFQVDRVQALLGEARVLGQRGEQLLHHGAVTSSRLGAQG